MLKPINRFAIELAVHDIDSCASCKHPLPVKDEFTDAKRVSVYVPWNGTPMRSDTEILCTTLP